MTSTVAVLSCSTGGLLSKLWQLWAKTTPDMHDNRSVGTVLNLSPAIDKKLSPVRLELRCLLQRYSVVTLTLSNLGMVKGFFTKR
jgi:hypothetical protein